MPQTADTLAEQVASDFLKQIDGIGKVIVPAIESSARKAGIPPLYLSWLLFEQPSDWRATVSGSAKSWLALALHLAIYDGEVPAYQRMEIPDLDAPGFDNRVDAAVKEMASWAEGNLLGELIRRYRKSLDKYIRDAHNVYQMADPRTSGSALTLHLGTLLRRNRLRVHRSLLLQRIFSRFEDAM